MAGTSNKPEDTRMQRDRLNAEQRKEQADKATKMSMASVTDQADEATGVWDPDTGELLEGGMTAEELAALRIANQVTDDDGVIDADDAAARPQSVNPNGSGPLGVPLPAPDMAKSDEVTDLTPQNEAPAVPVPNRLTPVRDEPKYVVRVARDVDPTIGRGKTYHLERGKRYRLPKHVVDHLDEKGLLASR